MGRGWRDFRNVELCEECVCSTVCVWFQFIFVTLFQEDVIIRKTAKHREEEEEGKRLSDTGRQ